MACGGANAKYYLSTPNYDPDLGFTSDGKVKKGQEITKGAANNHTYDSGDGRGVAPQEWDHFELQEQIIEAGFTIVRKFGTFASYRNYKESLNEWQQEMYNHIADKWDSNLVSNIMATVIEPELARNTLWVLERAK